MNVIMGNENEKVLGNRGTSKYKDLLENNTRIIVKNIGELKIEEKIEFEDSTLGKVSIQREGFSKIARVYWGEELTEEIFIYDTVGTISKIGGKLLYIATIRSSEVSKSLLVEFGKEVAEDEFIGNWVEEVNTIEGDIYSKVMIDMGGEYRWNWVKLGEEISEEDFIANWITSIEEVGGKHFYKARIDDVKKGNKWIRVELGKKITKKDRKRASFETSSIMVDEKGRFYYEVPGRKSRKKLYL